MFVPVLAAIIRNANREILLAQRRPTLANGGLWEFPGGKLHRNETPVAGLKREIREELGVDIDVLHPYHVVNYNDGKRSILLLAFEARLKNAHFKLVDHSIVEWAAAGDLLAYPLTPADIEVARLLKKEANSV